MIIGSHACHVVALLSCLYLTSYGYDWNDVTALDNYVQSDDGYYSYVELEHYAYAASDIYIVNMTSQKWQDESFCTRPIWWHIVGVAIPHEIRHTDYGILMIEGTDNDDDPIIPPRIAIPNVIARRVAEDTGIVSGYVLQVSNQPIVFSNDPTQNSRSEDEIIAWTWRTYLDATTKDPTVIARMPMTKAAKRGLDTIHSVAQAYVPLSNIDKFFVSGASKRGWTTWSLACTDQRVVGLIPMVFSLLNIPETIMNHYRDMGGAWSFAFSPYWRENLTQELQNPEIDGLYDVEDIYRYRDRLAGTPKLLISASGDEFFLCDENHYWWDDMPGPKWLQMIQNAEHIMAPHYPMILETLISFVISITDGITLPSVSWTMSETDMSGLIVIDTVPQPRNITAWSAMTSADDTRRDFRLIALKSDGEPGLHPGVGWRQDLEVVDFGDGRQYGVSAEKVDGEWTGFFIQGTWEGPAPHYYRLVFTTQVNILPGATFPVEPCGDPVTCYSHLV